MRTVLLLLTATAIVAACATSVPVVTLVESVPVETEWDTPAPQARAVWPAMFDAARETIDIAQFYIAHEEGKALQPTLDSLVRAADRGVKVRILVEKQMAEGTGPVVEKLAEHPNIEFAWFDIAEKTGGIIHAKYFVVDRREVFLGSQNFDWRALEHIHELGVRIHDPSVAAAVSLLFEADWRAMTAGDWSHPDLGPDRDRDGIPDSLDPEPEHALCTPHPGREPALLCPVFGPPELVPPGLRPSIDALLELLDNARSSIDIQVMSYDLRDGDEATWTVIDDALRRAAKRGVHVRMNISEWNTKMPRIDFLKALQRVSGIEVRINTIPEWSGGYIPFSRVDHCKYMIVDDAIAWVGTSNWSKGYFHSVRAVEFIYAGDLSSVKGKGGESAVSQLKEIFEKGWDGPYAEPLDLDREYVPRKHD